ncbi:hypothetical protein ACOCJ7_00815 [Knoellia sp. CPCC 206453]|uniref:hypothetical protein n=1 Tax=Knoellia pratensis TaxID=3404796 RepID=UPI003613C87D
MEPLPDALTTGPFSTTAARALGVPAQDLRRKGMLIPTRGARVTELPETLAARAAAFLVALPEDVAFSHITGAQLAELPLPRGLENQVDLDVMCRSGVGPIQRPGCIGHRGLETREAVRLRGLPVTGLAETWVDLGEVMKRGLDLDDLVVAGDVVARRLDEGMGEGEARGDRHGIDCLRSALMSRVRPRGKKVLVEALTLISPKSKSPMETRARLMFHRGGLPAPELNVSVEFEDGAGEGAVDGGAGWMLEGDFVWREQRVIGEYQGKHHKEIRQRAVDVARRHLAEDEGWTFVEIFAGDVYTRPKRIAMLRRLGRELGVPDSDLNLA